nr:hypothetical protein [Streptomyces sp. HNM0574]
MVVALTGGLTACTSAPDGGTGEDAKPGGPSATSTAAPGKYRTLPEPCGTVSTGLLKQLLPGAASSAGGGTATAGADEKTSPYEGEPSVTYDTDRQVGCKWKSSTTLGSHHLSIDLERVVSYDPSVSDDEQTELLYDERAGKAGIPTDEESGATDAESASPGSSESPGKGAEDGASTESPEGGAGKSAEDEEGEKANGGRNGHDDPSSDASAEPGSSAKSEDAENSGSQDGDSDKKGDNGTEEPGSSEESDSASPSPTEDLSPRTLDGIGEAAYINDEPSTDDSGVHRDITVVFRTANVIATIKYDEWPTDKQSTPDSHELQEQAQKVAGELAAVIEDE